MSRLNEAIEFARITRLNRRRGRRIQLEAADPAFRTCRKWPSAAALGLNR